MLTEAKKIFETIEEINEKKVFYEGKFHSVIGAEKNEAATYIILDDEGLIFPVNIYDIPNIYENNPISYDLQVLSVHADALTKHCEKWNIDTELKQFTIALD